MKLTTILIAFTLLFTSANCLAGDITEHQIIVPEEYSWGRGQEAFAGTSPIERYVTAYEKTWWRVMRAFVSGKQDWQNHAEFICSGTPAEAQACIDAYEAAKEKISALVKVSGEAKIKELIKERINQ